MNRSNIIITRNPIKIIVMISLSSGIYDVLLLLLLLLITKEKILLIVVLSFL